MSSFSSVVRKPGTAIKPKAPPRRNIQRKGPAPTPVADTREPSQGEVHNDEDQQVQSQHERLDVATLEISSAEPATNIITASSVDSSVPVAKAVTTIEPQNERQSVTIDQPDQYSKDSLVDAVTDAGSDLERNRQGRLQGRFPSEGEARDDSSLRPEYRTVGPFSIEDGDNMNSVTPKRTTSRTSRSSPSKRRKIISIPTSIVGRTEQTPEALSIGQRSPSTQPFPRQNGSHESSTDLFQSATDRAASVSQLANSIDLETRSRGLSHNPDTSAAISLIQLHKNNEALVGTIPAQERQNGKRKTIVQKAADVVANAIGGGKPKKGRACHREITPEDAEDYRLKPEEVTMGELVKDRKLGKKSQLEQEMQENWTQILERRRENLDKAMEAAQKRRRKAYGIKTMELVPAAPVAALMPAMSIVNGVIVSHAESRQIDRLGALEDAALSHTAAGVREDKPYYKKVNSHTVGMKASSARNFRWDDESDERFFTGLRWFGTDFSMIAKMFPGLDRKQLKMKFIREENADKGKVGQCLVNRIPVDLEEYSKVTNTEFQDPKDVQAEIEAEEQRLRDEDHERRVREGFISNVAADQPLPSAEAGERQNTGIEDENSSQYAALAAEVMAPRKRQRQTTSSARKRGQKAVRHPADGIEEALGSVHEVPV